MGEPTTRSAGRRRRPRRQARPAGLFGLRIPFLELLSARSKHWERGRPVVSLRLRPELTNSWGSAHGGIVTSLLDVAMGWRGHAHYHLEPRLEPVKWLLAEMRAHRIDRVALMAPVSEPIHLGPLGRGYWDAMRWVLAGGWPRLGRLLYRATVRPCGAKGSGKRDLKFAY